ncbi:MAG: replication-associated recombination protein A [Lachnospiraceae bacterium]|nr:replication-associated recombination protein A [Lachnospiraceae bacterium]
MDLFEYMANEKKEKEAPLAARLRPRTLDEVAGQQHIIGEGTLLARAIRADRLSSVIFYGPPGTGKTTLARVIANTTSAQFMQINATAAGKKDMEEVVRSAKEALGMYGKKTILFIDEIHRFNKAQQDYLLPFVEDGTLTLIGATTENPYFEVNSALISRSIIFELKPLSAEDIRGIIHKAVYDKERGMGMYDAVIDDDAEAFLADVANGDARHALNAIELGVLTTDRDTDGKIHITLEVAQQCIQKRALRYDKDGDNHYDTISAFIKSMRGSDPDAALYYLARMMAAGEEPEFIARRIMICASEDVGNADPNALRVAVNASLAAERLGWPESGIVLAQAATYVATAPKSNTAVEGIYAAQRLVEETGNLPIPPYLQDAHYPQSSKLGHGIGYEYAHEYEEHYSGQPYLPDDIRGEDLYMPSQNGYEAQIRKHMAHLTKKKKYTEKEHLAPRPDHETD